MAPRTSTTVSLRALTSSDLAASANKVTHNDKISQWLAVVEAGMRVQQLVGGSFSTLSATAIAALRKLRAAMAVAER
eukprot:9294210-Pyramimonas_sp.AAC.1